MVLLGLNAWLACALWPALVTGGSFMPRLGWMAFPPVSLGVGVAVLARRGGGPVAAVTLVLLYPLTLAAALAFGPATSLERLGGVPWLALAAFALLAFGAAAVLATQPTHAALEATVRPLADDPWDASPPDGRGLSRPVTVLLGAGAAALVLVAPTWGGSPALERAWGGAAREGALLTAVVAAALAVTTVASFLGSALRTPPTAEAPPIDRSLLVASLLLVALVGATTYVVVR